MFTKSVTWIVKRILYSYTLCFKYLIELSILWLLRAAKKGGQDAWLMLGVPKERRYHWKMLAWEPSLPQSNLEEEHQRAICKSRNDHWFRSSVIIPCFTFMINMFESTSKVLKPCTRYRPVTTRTSPLLIKQVLVDHVSGHMCQGWSTIYSGWTHSTSNDGNPYSMGNINPYLVRLTTLGV